MTASRQCKTTPRAPASTHARTNDRNGAASAASISSWDAPSNDVVRARLGDADAALDGDWNAARVRDAVDGGDDGGGA